jgi:hypothetical protein
MKYTYEVLFYTLSGFCSTGLLKLSSDDKLVGISTEENIESFKWKLDNKYYTADIQLSVLKHKTITSPDFSNSVEAVILYVDTSKVSKVTFFLA